MGDSSVLVSGISLPLVLHRLEDVSLFIGVAEVDGVMKGELWKDAADDDLAEVAIR